MNESLTVGQNTLKVYKSCGTLPYWNLCECGVALGKAAKGEIEERQAYRFLIKADWDEYDDLVIEEDLSEVWEKIVEEFKTIRHDSKIHEAETNKRKLIKESAKRIGEEAMIESLKIEQDTEFLAVMISRGYNFKEYYEKGDPDYWSHIEEAENRIKYHDHRIGVLRDSLKGPDIVETPYYKNMAYLSKVLKTEVPKDITVRGYFAKLDLAQYGTIR